MDLLDSARELRDAGRYQEALEALNGVSVSQRRTSLAALKAELLERRGQNDHALRVAEAVLRTKDVAFADRASCERVVGRLLLEDGDIDGALEHLQRSVSAAQRAGDLQQICESQIRLLILVAERSGPDAARPLLADVRQTATRLGDPRTTAELHLRIGELEAKRGLFDNALRHVATGQRLLRTAPNLWLEALAENVQLAVGILRSEFQTALRHGLRAVDVAEQSGSARIYGTCLTNVGNLYCATGDFEEAVEYFNRAERALPFGTERAVSRLDLIARMLLSQNRMEECGQILARLTESTSSPENELLYIHRHTGLTRAHLMARLGQTVEALAQCETVLTLAARTGDEYLSLLARLTKAELLQQTGRISEAGPILTVALSEMTRHSPELYAQSERILACGLAAEDDSQAAEAHYARARRIYATLRTTAGELELDRCWTQATTGRRELTSTTEAAVRSQDEPAGRHHARSVLHSAAAIILYPNRPELVARELLDLLDITDSVESATIISRAPDGTETALTRIGAEGRTLCGDSPTRQLTIGFAHEHAIEIQVRPRADIESSATVDAIALLLSAVHDLERARIEREERATLWPAEDLPIDGEHAVIAGQMREQMELARRIARTNVNVLITGESGTGKDILARAIHEFSARAAKPFVAFNCAAIPRDLLESQLFGHRRGSFTGADRDHAGVIRSARDGTLFLDEVGELSPDLQPKLLRFLESGEIAPLGEPALTVNVRIVAATNSNLEEAVRAGKFREDLFYRINVVRLTLRPLRERRDEIPGLVQHFIARAAEEFDKGHIRISEEAIERLILYRWPGNVRQLQNEVRRMVALAEPDSTLAPGAISDEILGALPLMRPTVNGTEIAVSLQDKLLPTLARIESEMIKAALTQHRGRVDAVAKSLGISRKGLYLKRQRLGLQDRS